MEASAPPGDGEWDVINQATKGQTIMLGTDGLFRVKATWSSTTTTGGASGGGGIDVDLSAVLLHKDGTAIEAVFFNHTKSTAAGAVSLVSGDQQLGSVGEELHLRLQSIPAEVHAVAFVLSSGGEVPLSHVNGLCVSATLSEQTSSMECDHLTWHQAASQPSSPAAAAAAAAIHTVTLPMFLKRSGLNNAPSHQWMLRVTDEVLSNCRTFVDGLPGIRSACGVGSGDGTAATNFKIPVVLQKDQQMLIHTAARGGNSSGTTIHVGCGWDIVDDKEVDTDLSALCLSREGEILDFIYWGKMSAFDGHFVHSGDNQTGDGDCDDESLVINLSALPTTVYAIVFLVSNYSEGSMKSTSNIHFRLVRMVDSMELVRFEAIGQGGDYSGFIPCSLSRTKQDDSTWQLRCHAAPCQGKTVHDEQVMATVRQLVAELSADSGPTIKPINLRSALKARQATADKNLKGKKTGGAEPPRTERGGAQAVGGGGPSPSDWIAGMSTDKKIALFFLFVLIAWFVLLVK